MFDILHIISTISPILSFISFMVMVQSYIIGRNRKRIQKLECLILNQDKLLDKMNQNQKYLIKLLKRKTPPLT